MSSLLALILVVRIAWGNLLMGLVLALLFALGMRSLLLLFVDKGHGSRVIILRTAAAVTFLAVGWLYALFGAPMMVWERLPRAVAATSGVGLLLAAAARRIKRPPTIAPSPKTALATGSALVVLVFLSALTLLQTGFVALIGDRVPFLVEVTGEARMTHPNEPMRGQTPANSVMTHHVLIWHPRGIPVADVWLCGERFAVRGRALRLKRWGLPNFYRFDEIGVGPPGEAGACPHQEIPFPNSGPLAIHPWWRPVDERLLRIFLDRAPLMVSSDSPYYPLVEASGKHLRQTFLLDLTPSGMATSRGSSPFESSKAAPTR